MKLAACKVLGARPMPVFTEIVEYDLLGKEFIKIKTERDINKTEFFMNSFFRFNNSQWPTISGKMATKVSAKRVRFRTIIHARKLNTIMTENLRRSWILFLTMII